MAKDTVIFYQEQVDICRRHLSAEQFGRLMYALFEIDNGEDPDVDDDIIMAFEFMALQKRIDAAKYNAKVQHNREIAKLGGAPKGNQNARKHPKTTQNNPKQPNAKKNNPNDNDNDNVNENDNDNDNEQTSPSVIIKYLNFKTGADYDPDDEFNHQLVNDLIDQGYDYNDLMKVVNKKCSEWMNDSVMRSYLRPSTLFGSKFAEYLAQPESLQAETERKKTDELKDVKAYLKAKRKALKEVRSALEDPELIEESTHNIDSEFYQLRDQEAILEADISRLEARASALGG